jgi:hypothetical protein
MKNTSKNGQLFICSSCKKIHLEFGNIGMDFQSPERLNELLSFLQTVSSNHFSFENTGNNNRRKILVPFANAPVKLLLNEAEIHEISELISSFLNRPCCKVSSGLSNLKAISNLNGIILN